MPDRKINRKVAGNRMDFISDSIGFIKGIVELLNCLIIRLLNHNTSDTLLSFKADANIPAVSVNPIINDGVMVKASVGKSFRPDSKNLSELLNQQSDN